MQTADAAEATCSSTCASPTTLKAAPRISAVDPCNFSAAIHAGTPGHRARSIIVEELYMRRQGHEVQMLRKATLLWMSITERV